MSRPVPAPARRLPIGPAAGTDRPTGPAAAVHGGPVAMLLGRLGRDSLYRNALFLFANTILSSAFGMAFWLVSARLYTPGEVGVFAGLVATAGLLSAIAVLGLPNTIVKFYPVEPRNRDLVLTAAVAVGVLAGAGAGVCLWLRADLGLRNLDTGNLLALAPLLCCAAAGLAAGTVIDASFVGARATHLLLIKNLAASAAKLSALPLLAGLGGVGLFSAYLTGVLVSMLVSLLLMLRRLGAQGTRPLDLRLLRTRSRFSAGNYLGTLFGMLPSSVLPLLVLGRLGAGQAGFFAVVFLLVTFMSYIPSTAAQSMLAEAAHQEEPFRRLLLRAVRGVYLLVTPLVLVVVVASPWILQVFGSSYAAAGSASLRLLAIAGLFTAGNYLVDVALLALERVRAYIAINSVNSALVLLLAGLGLSHGLAGLALGWLVAQALSLLLGVALLARSNRPAAGMSPTGTGTVQA